MNWDCDEMHMNRELPDMVFDDNTMGDEYG